MATVGPTWTGVQAGAFRRERAPHKKHAPGGRRDTGIFDTGVSDPRPHGALLRSHPPDISRHPTALPKTSGGLAGATVLDPPTSAPPTPPPRRLRHTPPTHPLRE